MSGASFHPPTFAAADGQAPTTQGSLSLAEAHIAEIDPKLSELQSDQAALAHRVHVCHGDDRPDCPIMDTLEAVHPQRASRA